eukprot:scaffold2125_cov126-Cylindrotheca_fusiformis.AAC.3
MESYVCPTGAAFETASVPSLDETRLLEILRGQMIHSKSRTFPALSAAGVWMLKIYEKRLRFDSTQDRVTINGIPVIEPDLLVLMEFSMELKESYFQDPSLPANKSILYLVNKVGNYSISVCRCSSRLD